MEIVLWISSLLLWVAVLLVCFAVFALYRHHGRMLLHSRDGREDQGPAIEKRLPIAQVRDIEGRVINLGIQGRPQFIFFAQTHCKPCQDARASLAHFADEHHDSIETILVFAGLPSDMRDVAARLPQTVRVVPETNRQLFTKMHVSSTPFALVTDADGVVRGKGMPVLPEAFAWFASRLDNHANTRPSIELNPITVVGTDA